MASQVTDYKCPACTGPLHYQGSTGRLECDYCGSTFSVEEIEKLYAEQNKKAEEASDQAEAELKEQEETADDWEYTSEQWTDKGIKVYNCPSCGAELIVDETTAATECPYCGNPTIVPGQFKDTLKPEFVIPFKLDKNAAIDALKKHYKGKPFLPKAFTANNHIEEIKGVYVPFWLYNGAAHAEGTYEATRSHRHREGDYEVTTTEHFHVERAGDIEFEKIPADASSHMPDDLMDSIEPYNYEELKEFSMSYLPGFYADKYDVSAEDDAYRATRRAKNTALGTMKSDIAGFETVMPIREDAFVKQGKISYAMMPVWLLSTKWNDGNYLFAMNGQTGRLVGDLPIDKKKMWGTFFGIAAALEVLMAVLTFVL